MMELFETYNKIPEGYRWCDECNALTPIRPGFAGGWHCIICGSYNSGIIACPNCGAEETEELFSEDVVTVHQPGCHRDCVEEEGYLWIGDWADDILNKFRPDFMRPAPYRGTYMLPRDKEWYDENRRLTKLLEEHDEKFQCGCPRYTTYRNINQMMVASGYGHGMDCMNDMWWEYRVRCRICGFIYEASDSSC